MLLSVVLVSTVLGESKLRGFIGLFMGLTIGLVGLDLSTGQPRLTFGLLELADGIDIVVVAVGIFAIGEALWVAAHLRRRPVDVIPVGQPFMARSDWRRSWGPWVRGTAIGFPFGAIPAGGAETPTFLSYVLERRLQKPGEGPGAVRRGRHRGRGRTGGRQQRQRRRHVRAAAGPRPARDRDRRGDHRRDAHLRHPARPDADGRPARARLDAAGQPAHRQHPPAGDQPSAGPVVGPAAADPAAPALRRDPVLRVAGRLQRQPGPVRPAAAAALRRDRFRDPAVRDPGAAVDPRRDPRTADGAEDARGARPVQRRHQRPVQRGPGGRPLRSHRGHHRGAVRRRAASADRRSAA